MARPDSLKGGLMDMDRVQAPSEGQLEDLSRRNYGHITNHATSSGTTAKPRRGYKSLKCVGCKETKNTHTRGLCSGCYRKSTRRVVECIACNGVKPLCSQGMCRTCYERKKREKRSARGLCTQCGRDRGDCPTATCARCLKGRKQSRRRPPKNW
jgi:hypothetical protein